MNVDWLTLSQYSGQTGQTTISGAVTDNLNIGVKRYATVRFTNSEGLYADLKITQEASTEGLQFEVSPYLLQFQTSGETLTGTVFSNSKWFITEYPSWIKITSDNPDMTGAGNLFFTVEPNTGDTELSGNIKIESYGEERLIYAIQPSYKTLQVTPKEVMMTGVTADSITTSVTVSSSTLWEIGEYDSNYLEFNVLSGVSGITTLLVTLKNIPQYVRKLDLPFSKTFSVTDHMTTEIVTIGTRSTENIDDNAVTVTYNIPAAGSYCVYKYNKCNGCPPWSYELQDEYTIWAKEDSSIEQIAGSCLQMGYVYFYFSTPGKHKVKYYSNLYSTPYAVFHNNKNIESVVFGDKNNGGIAEYSFCGSSISKIILGQGTHTLYGYAFGNCSLGSLFYLPSTCKLAKDFGTVFSNTSCGTFFYDLTENIYPSGGRTSGKGIGRLGYGNDCDHWFVLSKTYAAYSYESDASNVLKLDYDRFIIAKNIGSFGKLAGCFISGPFTCHRTEIGNNQTAKEYEVLSTGRAGSRIGSIIFMGNKAPTFYTSGPGSSSISYSGGNWSDTRPISNIDVYYPEGGTDYTSKWSRSFVTLHSYTNIDDII